MGAGKKAVAGLAALVCMSACSSNATRIDPARTGIDAGMDGQRTKPDGGLPVKDAAGIDVSRGETAWVRDVRATGDARDGAKDDASRDVSVVGDGASSSAIDGGRQPGRDVAAFDAPSPRSGTCANPLRIAFQGMHADVLATNVGADHLFELPCAENGADLVLSLSVEDSEVVYADTFGASWDTILAFSETCPPEDSVADVATGLDGCSNDACGTSQSQAMALVGYGTHYLILSGAQGATGQATLHLDRTVVGNGTFLPMPEGTGSVEGATAGQGLSDLCEAGGPEDTYWWTTCPNFPGGDFFASTCGGTLYDTVLALQVPRARSVVCNDDDNTCGRQSTVTMTLPPGAGLQALLVDGHVGTAAGPYTLAYTRP
jgi:hypothetical protein